MIEDERIKIFIDQFGGDIDAAKSALERFATAEQAIVRAPKRPLSDEVIITTNDLKKTYKVGRQHISALDGVSIAVHKGEFLALTGPSGSGKSTLL